MAPIVGIPAQLVVQHMKDQLIAKFYGDGKSTGIVKSLENAKLGSLTLGGIAGLGAAAAFVSGAAIPAIAALTAVAYSGLAGGVVSKLAKDHQEGRFYQLRDGLQEGNIGSVLGAQPPRSIVGEPELTADEAEATRWMRNAYNSRGNMPRAMAWFADDFAHRNGRDPQINWLKVGIASGDKNLVDVMTEFANRRHLDEAVSFIAVKGGVADEITRRVVGAEVANAQRDRLDRLNPDSPRSGKGASWFAYLKEKVTTAFTKRQELDAAMGEVKLMSDVERLTGGAHRQRPSEGGIKAAFADDADGWKGEAPKMLDRVVARHDRLREVAQPMRDAASL